MTIIAAIVATLLFLNLWLLVYQAIYGTDGQESELQKQARQELDQWPILRIRKGSSALAAVVIFLVCGYGHAKTVDFVVQNLWSFRPAPPRALDVYWAEKEGVALPATFYESVLVMAFLAGGVAGVQAFFLIRRLKGSANKAAQRALLSETLGNELQRIIHCNDRGEVLGMAAHFQNMMTAFNGSPRTLERRHEYPEEFEKHQLSIESGHDTLKLFDLYNTLHKAAETQARKLAEAAGGYWELPHDTYDGTELGTYAPVWVPIDPPKQGEADEEVRPS